MTYLSCGGGETRLEYCLHMHNYKPCTHSQDVSVYCRQGTTDIRLFGGTSSSGTVEVLYGGVWSTVCGNNWDINDAHAACRQLHFERAESIFSNGTFRGSEPGAYELSNFRCGGSEKRLLDCPTTTSTVCQHSHDAGVKCEIDKPPNFNCSELQVCSQTGRKLICACVEDEEHELTNMTGSTEGPCRNDDPTNPTKIHLCRNRTGDFSCGCVEGFQLTIENIFCQSETTHDCNTMQSCRNTKGGYDCPCIEGYTRNNETGECDDIDECSTDYMNCPEAQICNTFNKTIFCECLEGNATDCDLDNCTNICAGVEVCTNDACSCHQGYFLNTENMPCEGGGCGEMIHECTDMETCNNTIGGYECPCMNGFLRGQGVNATCDDIDECMEETDGCDHLCMNTVGGYSCACVAGFTLLEDRHTCVMPMSLQEAYMAVKEGGTTKRSSIGGWFFPLGMIVACALVAAVVIGRKKSERFRDGTDRMMSAADCSSGRHGSQFSPVKPRSNTADGMGDTPV
ncbi:adhesion G protein-coupled receptor E1-like [Asterias rubens]|uniref:adhesion G protein-coupled receptor E1-like n=1 Tax=Asterias rubens TaxID=7604 RepID=UPI00145562B6|nr:adhesion G protein-coupled receptor E1-like [Asterias rubens]